MPDSNRQNNPTGEGWAYERQHIRAEVKRNADDISRLRDDLIRKIDVVQENLRDADKDVWDALNGLKGDVAETFTLVRIDVAALKVKAGIWGGLSGALVAVGGLLFAYLKK